MKALELEVGRPVVANVVCVVVVGLIFASSAIAGPVVREAVATDAAGIQAAVDLFRADVGNPNNGNAPGSQLGGRREINWDGGGAAATPTLAIPGPMLNFANRGSIFFTPGVGLEISGAPLAEFGEINPNYPNLFNVFSPPRLFAALNSNIVDVVFHVPGNTAIPAASSGFGAVFTDVDSATSTKMEFYAPDGTLLYEKTVLAGAGDAYLSFLGVSFDAGELIARVRIVSGNAALGPDETGTVDLVVMDDFIYAEPVATQGLTITPESGKIFRAASFELVLGIQVPAGATLTSGRVELDGADVTAFLLSCFQTGTGGGGQTFSCPIPGNTLPAGDHTLQVELDLSNQTRLRNAVRWTVIQ
jgi:hypothetical protein